MNNENILYKAISYDKKMVILLLERCDKSYIVDCTINDNHTAYKVYDKHIAMLTWRQKVKDLKRFDKFVIVPPIGQLA